MKVSLLRMSGIGIAHLVEGDIVQVIGQSSFSYVSEFASLVVISCIFIFFPFLPFFLLFLTFSLDFRLVTSLHIHSSNMKQSWKKLNETRFSFWYKMHFKHQDFSAVVELLQLTDQSCWAGRGVLFTTGLLPAEPQNFYKNLKQSFL